MSTFKVKDVDKGIYTETESKSSEISLAHIDNMIEQREKKLIDIQGEIDYFKAKRDAIKALPGYKEPKPE